MLDIFNIYWYDCALIKLKSVSLKYSIDSFYKSLRAVDTPSLLRFAEEFSSEHGPEELLLGPFSELLTKVDQDVLNKELSVVDAGQLLGSFMDCLLHVSSTLGFETLYPKPLMLLPIGDSFQSARGELLYLFLLKLGWEVSYLAPNLSEREVFSFVDASSLGAALIVHREQEESSSRLISELCKRGLLVASYSHGSEDSSASVLSSLREVSDFLFLNEVHDSSRASFEDFQLIMAKRIKEFRKLKGLSQTNLAELADVNRSFLSSLENGKANPSLSLLYRICIILEISIDKLLSSEINPS